MRPARTADNFAIVVVLNVKVRMEAQHSIRPLGLHDLLRESFIFFCHWYILRRAKLKNNCFGPSYRSHWKVPMFRSCVWVWGTCVIMLTGRPRRTCPSAALFTTNPTWTGPGHHDEETATAWAMLRQFLGPNRLDCGFDGSGFGFR